MPTKRTAKYHRLKEILIEKLDRGELKPGQLFPSDNQLMAEHGLSRSTVRQAMSELVSEGLLERIQGKGTYVSAKAAGPRPAIEYAELVFYAGEQTLRGSGFYRDVLGGIEQELDGTGTALLIHGLCRARDFKGTPRPKCISNHLPGGLLIFEIFDGRYIAELVAAGLPTVVVDHAPPGIDVASVTFDNRSGATRAAATLLAAGHGEIAFLRGLISQQSGRYVEDPASMDRHDGWRAALEDAGLYREDLVGVGHQSPEGGYRAMREVLERGCRPAAVLAAGSGMCVGAARAASEAGLTGRDGRALSLVGFGSPGERPGEGIRVIACDGVEMGRQAARKLQALARGEGDPHEAVRIPLREIG